MPSRPSGGRRSQRSARCGRCLSYPPKHRRNPSGTTEPADLIVKTPVRGINLPAIPTPDHRYLTSAEIGDLASVIDPRSRAFVVLAAGSGGRWGELAALTIDRVDLLRRSLTVQASLGRSGESGPPKSKAGRRTVSLPKSVADAVAEHLNNYALGEGGLVFTSTAGTPLRYTNWRRRVWLPAVAASVGEPCTFHDLRHTHAAMLIAQNAHPKVIQSRLGHARITTTLDTYGHLFEGLDEAAAEGLEKLFSGLGVSPECHGSVTPLRTTSAGG